ncbi:PREDICTED: protein PAT1 homolog 1-like isoform X1 [Acropora digitifera]|uniref:protein PAT1 homolog 1-like isoform X1 n=1 Tax=Acropora digitifera TaxID=70779 RepID=UPI00077A971B|nr:PREDICTED: protein PAT1 homolog 1-like isoform X1 [Acropora digitifera]
MAGALFGFNSEIPAFEDEDLSELDPTLTNLDDGNTYDELNDDTFGAGALEDDWELSHRKLTGINDEGTQGSQVTDWIREKDIEKRGPKPSKSRDEQSHLQEDFEDELNREEEILQQHLAKLVDDDDTDAITIPRTSTKYKDIKHPSGVNPIWDGSSPLSSPTSSSSINHLISPSSNIWGSPSKIDKENKNKGPVNTQRSPLDPLIKAESERKQKLRRPFSPAFEDDSIVTAIPPPGLLPPSRFMKKSPPVNAIRLEDLEKELTGDKSAPQQVPELPKEALRKTMIGQPPPGIPMPVMAPPGFRSPAPRMQTRPVLHHMFQTPRPSNSKQPIPPGMAGMPGILGPVPSPHLLRTPRTPVRARDPFSMMHTDPGRLMLRGGLLGNFPMSPQHARFSSPQLHNRRFQDPRQNFPRNQYDNRWFHDGRSPRQQDRGEHQHQFTDLERKIHNILTLCEDGSRKDDPYAGLMTRREKEWLIKIQLLQLTSNQPDLDDYYFQTYTRRKTSKEHVEQSEGVQLKLNVPEDNKEVRETTKMALPQFEREKRNYTPVDFQGSLGKVSSASVQHPRQMVDLTIVRNAKAPEQDKQGVTTPLKDTKKRSQVLITIEKGYDFLLNIESIDKKLIHVDGEERNKVVETRQIALTKLFNLFKLSTEECDRFDDELFVQFLFIQKGRNLFSRALSMFNKVQIEAVLMAISRNILLLIKRDSGDESLQNLIVPINRVSELISPPAVMRCLRSMVFAQSNSTNQGSPLSVVLVNQFGSAMFSALLGRAAVISNGLTESEDEMRKSWLNIVSQVSTEFQDIPVKQLGRNLDAAERLVALVSSSTDIQTRALLQEHLRLASSTKPEIET